MIGVFARTALALARLSSDGTRYERGLFGIAEQFQTRHKIKMLVINFPMLF